jgi:glycosyltransferase involved in cell wall biosynthesis
VSVHELATPLRYRWMGLTPAAPLALARLRPDIVHVFGFRDPIGTAAALASRASRVPYVLEPLGMLWAGWRKQALKRMLDGTALRPVVRGAALLVAVSERERDAIAATGVDPAHVVVRPNGFPDPADPPAGQPLRAALGLEAEVPLVLYVGRLARGKGLPLLLEAFAAVPGAHVALVGPWGRDGTAEELAAASSRPQLAGRVHVLPPIEGDAVALFAEADVAVLPSEGESFGIAAAEAAAAGTPTVVTDRCGIALLVDGRAGLVVPFEAPPLRDALARLVGDASLRRRLGEGGRALARELSWGHVVERQEEIYRRALD